MKRVLKVLEDLSEKEGIKVMNGYIQHGDTSCLMHTVAVAYYSLQLAEKLHIPVHKRELVRGALLHDYFLYDWHDGNGRKIHGFTHPKAAMKNADRDFGLKKLEKGIIKRHMFPLTPIPPTSREAWIVCLVDKYCSLKETLGRDNYKSLRKMWIKDNRELFLKVRDRKNDR